MDNSKCPFHEMLKPSSREGGALKKIEKDSSVFLYDGLSIDDAKVSEILKDWDLSKVDDIIGLNQTLAKRYYKKCIDSFVQDAGYSHYFDEKIYDFSDKDFFDDIVEKAHQWLSPETVLRPFMDIPLGELYNCNKKINKKIMKFVNSLPEEDKNKIRLYIKTIQYVLPDSKTTEYMLPSKAIDIVFLFSPIFWMATQIFRYIVQKQREGTLSVSNKDVPAYFYEVAKIGWPYHFLLYKLLKDRVSANNIPYVDTSTWKLTDEFKRIYTKYRSWELQDNNIDQIMYLKQKNYNTDIRAMDHQIYACPSIREFKKYYMLLLWIIDDIQKEYKQKKSHKEI